MTLPNAATVTYVYDNDGELTDTTDADGRRTTYSYDSDGDQTGETWVGASPSEKITYTYDADNELTGANDGFATLTFTYDSGGNELTAATSGPGTGQPSVTLTSGYNAQHSLTSVADNISGNAGLDHVPVRCRSEADHDHDVIQRHGRPADRDELCAEQPDLGAIAHDRRQRHGGQYNVSVRCRGPANDDHRLCLRRLGAGNLRLYL